MRRARRTSERLDPALARTADDADPLFHTTPSQNAASQRAPQSHSTPETRTPRQAAISAVLQSLQRRLHRRSLAASRVVSRLPCCSAPVGEDLPSVACCTSSLAESSIVACQASSILPHHSSRTRIELASHGRDCSSRPRTVMHIVATHLGVLLAPVCQSDASAAVLV